MTLDLLSQPMRCDVRLSSFRPCLCLSLHTRNLFPSSCHVRLFIPDIRNTLLFDDHGRPLREARERIEPGNDRLRKETVSSQAIDA